MKTPTILYSIFILLVFFGCREDNLTTEISEEETAELDYTTYPDWSINTHSNEADPDYTTVFNQTEVHRFDITISSDDWSDMQSNISSLYGSTGGRPGMPANVSSSSSENPMWVPCSFKYDGTEWYKVGIRYKGNSSLQSAYQSGNKKLSLKLDFDEFEDDYPELKNQRFYGFKQLNLNNNYNDQSLMREKVGADMFREFGLVSAQTSFCVVYLDNGSGPQYYGVYTLVEEIDDTALDTQLGSDTANLYKPDGDAASFYAGTYNEDELVKKNNESEADYSDVKALYNILNSSDRTNNSENWKKDLEDVFNVDGFLKWLAANTVIQNWDTYGRMTHNYYLYNVEGQLTWIPWDNNEAFQTGKQGGALDLAMSTVGNQWPLITYLLDQEEYKSSYERYLQQFIDEVFIPEKMINTYSTYNDLIKEYAYQEVSGYTYVYSSTNYDKAVATLKTHVQSRNDAVNAYLN